MYNTRQRYDIYGGDPPFSYEEIDFIPVAKFEECLE